MSSSSEEEAKSRRVSVPSHPLVMEDALLSHSPKLRSPNRSNEGKSPLLQRRATAGAQQSPLLAKKEQQSPQVAKKEITEPSHLRRASDSLQPGSHHDQALRVPKVKSLEGTGVKTRPTGAPPLPPTMEGSSSPSPQPSPSLSSKSVKVQLRKSTGVPVTKKVVAPAPPEPPQEAAGFRRSVSLGNLQVDQPFLDGVSKRVRAARAQLETAAWAEGGLSEPTSPGKESVLVAKASLTASTGEHLAFKKGEMLKAVEQFNNDEWICENSSGARGLVSLLWCDARSSVAYAKQEQFLTQTLSGSRAWLKGVLEGTKASSRKMIVHSLVSIFEGQGEGLSFLTHVGSEEMADPASEAATVCTGKNSCFGLLLRDYAARYCSGFFQQIIPATVSLLQSVDGMEGSGSKSSYKLMDKCMKVVCGGLLTQVITEGGNTFPVNLRILLKSMEAFFKERFPAEKGFLTRLLFGMLIGPALLDHDSTANLQTSSRTSLEDVYEIIYHMACELPFRDKEHFAGLEPHRKAVKKLMEDATVSVFSGVDFSNDRFAAHIVAKMAAAAKNDAMADAQKVWRQLHRALSVNRDKIEKMMPAQEKEAFHSTLSKMGPPAYAAFYLTDEADDPPAIACASILEEDDGEGFLGRRRSSKFAINKHRTRSDQKMGKKGDEKDKAASPSSLGRKETEAEVASLLALAKRLCAFRESPDHSTLLLDKCKLKEVPNDIGAFTTVTKLVLSHNQLTSFPLFVSTMTQLVDLDLSFNKMENLPVPTVLSMNLKYLNLLGNPFPAPMNYLTQGTIPVDTMFFLKNVDRFLLLFEAVSGELDDKSRPRLDDLLRRFPTHQLARWTEFAWSYRLQQRPAKGRGSTTKIPNPKDANKEFTIVPLNGSFVDKVVLNFGYAPGQLAPVFKRLKTSFTLTNASAAKATFVMHPPNKSSLANVECEPSEIVLGKGKSCEIEVFVTCVCTTKLQEPIRVQMNPTHLTLFLWIEMDTELSFQLNADDLTMMEKVGAGGAGSVYLGRWRERDVAVKKYIMGEDGDTEAKMMAQLRHPNIVCFYGVVRARDAMESTMLITEYVSMGSLDRCLLDHKIELCWWLRGKMASDTARALDYLHNRNIIHRDLKSSNLLVETLDLTADVHIKLCDFGIARSLHTDMTAAQGTALWMAPECFSKQPYTQAADIWSYGIILGELALREPPFENLSFFEALNAVSRGEVKPLPASVPESMRNLRDSCTKLSPTARPTSMNLLIKVEELLLTDPAFRKPRLGRRKSDEMDKKADVLNEGMSGPDIQKLMYTWGEFSPSSGEEDD